jgi:hypothetical protein
MADVNYARIPTDSVWVKDGKATGVDAKTVYLVIPTEWLPLYHRLLCLVADFGKSILDDCNFACRGTGGVIFTCWNLFQSACAAYATKQYDEAQLYINYVSSQIKNTYKASTVSDRDGTLKYAISKDGTVEVTGVIDGDEVKFIDSIDGHGNVVTENDWTIIDKETNDIYRRVYSDKENDGKDGETFVED